MFKLYYIFKKTSEGDVLVQLCAAYPPDLATLDLPPLKEDERYLEPQEVTASEPYWWVFLQYRDQFKAALEKGDRDAALQMAVLAFDMNRQHHERYAGEIMDKQAEQIIIANHREWIMRVRFDDDVDNRRATELLDTLEELEGVKRIPRRRPPGMAPLHVYDIHLEMGADKRLLARAIRAISQVDLISGDPDMRKLSDAGNRLRNAERWIQAAGFETQMSDPDRLTYLHQAAETIAVAAEQLQSVYEVWDSGADGPIS